MTRVTIPAQKLHRRSLARSGKTGYIQNRSESIEPADIVSRDARLDSPKVCGIS
jgi:hypothetical protein